MPFGRLLRLPFLRRNNNAAAQVDQGNNQPPPAAPPVPVPPTNQLVLIRDRLFHVLFYRMAAHYSRGVSAPLRRLVEFWTLVTAIFSFALLIYIHLTFAKVAVTCLNDKNWPRDGVLRVEILPNATFMTNYSLLNSYKKEYPRLDIHIISDGGIQKNKTTRPIAKVYYNKSLQLDNITYYDVDTRLGRYTKAYHLEKGVSKLLGKEQGYYSKKGDMNQSFTNPHEEITETVQEDVVEPSDEAQVEDLWTSLSDSFLSDERYIVEYALELGFLRLTPKTRFRLHVPVKLILLDPLNDTCFGGPFTRFMLQEFVGYDDVLLASVKMLAESEKNRGYVRNVISGENFRFVAVSTPHLSYLTAFCVMIVFTCSISMLLRFSHNQIFFFIVELLQMFETNVLVALPITPLFTVILALVGIEAIMSEFFNDTTTAFYVILIVWIADQYDAVCSHTSVTRKYWLRFFYLYLFAFYAYHYRFHGQYGGLALATSWFFIQHSMIYFFHHFELQALNQQRTHHENNHHSDDDTPQPTDPSDDEVANENLDFVLNGGNLNVAPNEEEHLAENQNNLNQIIDERHNRTPMETQSERGVPENAQQSAKMKDSGDFVCLDGEHQEKDRLGAISRTMLGSSKEVRNGREEGRSLANDNNSGAAEF